MTLSSPLLKTARQLPLTVVPLTDAELDSLCRLETAAHSHPWTRKLLQSALQRHHCWGVRADGELVGFALVSLVLGEAELLDFVVDPARQGQGIGRCFLAWLLGWLQGRADSFYLEVRASNSAAITLYENAGFNEIGVRPNYYPGRQGREDALLMAMQLPAPEPV